jgi:type I restriction enzyme S subunit
MMRAVSLGDIATIESGTVFPNALQGLGRGDYPFAKVADISQAIASGTHQISGARNYVSAETAKALRVTPFHAGTIVFAKIGEAIRLNNRAITTRPMLFDNNVMGVTPNLEVIDVNYLFYFLQTLDFYALANATAVPALRKSDLAEIEVPFPALPKQREIAAKLTAGAQLRRTRRFSFTLCDEFLTAAFLQMFGDPIKNPKGFDLVPLEEELDRIDSGYSPVCEGPRRSAAEWAVLGLGAVTWGRFDPTANKRLPSNKLPRTDLEVRHGDLLVTRKNTYELVAACALVKNPPPRLLLPDTIFRFRLRNGSRLSFGYLWALLSFPSFRSSKVQALAAGSAGSMPGISKEKFMTIHCPAPPSAAQDDFQKILDRSIHLREQHIEAVRQADHLFQTLLHQAFI